MGKEIFKVVLVISILLFNLSFLHATSIPSDWWGKVIINGEIENNSAAVDAYIDDMKVADAIVGEYASEYYLIHVPGHPGDFVEFKVNNINAENDLQKWIFGSNRLDLIINLPSKPEEPEPTESKKSFSNINDWGGEFCYPNWKCSGWGSCYNGIKTRTCYDANHCDFSYNKPNEKLTCQEGVQEKSFTDDKLGRAMILPLVFITGIFILILGILWVEIGK